MRTRFLVACVTLLLPASTAMATRGRVLQPDKFVILSTTDVKGKTGPCGCHIPKGGLARRAGFADSIRTQYGQVALVDAGGFFPEGDGQQDVAAFVIDAMTRMNTDAVGVAERDLRYGTSFLRAQVERTGLPLVCANLIDARSNRPVFDPYRIEKVGGVKVGFFGLIGDKVDLGPSRDSLRVGDPAAAARQTIAEMRKKGATVVVLLGQLGKVENEDIVSAVDGVNALVVGSNTPIIAKGRMIKNTVACYGGDQGHYVCETVLSLDGRRQVTGGEADAVMMGPDVGDRPEIRRLVKTFDDATNEKRKAAAPSAPAAGVDGGGR